MRDIPDIRIEDYTYDLPLEAIARFPLNKRDGSRLLYYKSGRIRDTVFHNLPDLLPGNAHLIFNNTRVIHARLPFHKKSGARIEIFCLDPIQPASFESALDETQRTIWTCMIGNKRKWKTGSLSEVIDVGNKTIELVAAYGDISENQVTFTWDDPSISFSEILKVYGKIPIPPYLKRDSEALDQVAYQTIYGIKKGSVAAPTAGLHFTQSVLEQLQAQHYKMTELTLHVSAGTFKPVQAKRIRDHKMHTEFFSIGREALHSLARNNNAVIAIGTTSLRTLESLYWLGLKLHNHGPDAGFQLQQWEPYTMKPTLSRTAAFQTLYQYLVDQNLEYLEGHTRLIIVPGYPFQVTAGLLTNYHLPRSTLLLLVAAFIGEDWRKVYQYALEHNLRFLSYGDSSLLIPG